MQPKQKTESYVMWKRCEKGHVNHEEEREGVWLEHCRCFFAFFFFQSFVIPS